MASSGANAGAGAGEGGTTSDGLGNVIADHYNKLDEKGLEQRKESRIFFMRNFNNWTKSMLINEYMEKIHKSLESRSPREGETAPTADAPRRICALDIGCGKGGDLLKWQKARVHHVTCADIAQTSVEQAQIRYSEMKNRNRNQRLFSAEFIAADCTKTNLKTRYQNPNIKFDIVSCQFAFHYCFESLPQAECLLRNASECLKPGGYFIGTTPDAYDIIHRVKNADSTAVGNDVYSITFEDEDTLKNPPLFGAKYQFHLEGVVDCPEFLVHFPTLEKLAAKFNLLLVGRRRFGNYFKDIKDHKEGRDLLSRMSALETYPHQEGTNAASQKKEDYTHAKDFMKTDPSLKYIGTLTKDEWEAITLYTTFAFKKMN